MGDVRTEERCLLAFGSPGGSQVPGGGAGPPVLLRDTEDLAALRCVLEAAATVQAMPTQDGIVFRIAAVLGSKRLYKGHLQTPVLADRAATAIQTQALYFAHQVGTPCAIPPDQLFLLIPTIAPGGPSPSPQFDRIEYDFLLELLDGLSQQTLVPELSSLARWFDSSPQFVLTGIETQHSGSQCWCELTFTDETASPPTNRKHTVLATRGAAGFIQWTVR